MKAFVFTTNRALKAFYEEQKNKDALLDKAFSVRDFFASLLLSDKFKASEYERLLLMQKACKQCKKSEEVLKIPSNFFAFLKNYEYLFSFFKELCLAKKEIKDLKNQDLYALYDEHLDILDELLKNYFCNLEKANLYDELSLIKNFKLNLDFLKNYESIVFYMDGFLSPFESELLELISKELPLSLHFKTSQFNLDFLKSLSFLKELELEKNKAYIFDLNTKKLSLEGDFSHQASFVSVQKFELRSLQVSFVFNEISKFVRAGIEPSKIALITPDESFCELLRLFDRYNMLNFASGISIKTSLFYQRLKALYNALIDDNFSYDENEAYFSDEKTSFDLKNTLLKSFDLKVYKELKKELLEEVDFEYFSSFILSLIEDESLEIRDQIQNELFFIKSLLEFEKLSLKELLELFIMKLSSLKQSFVGGGAVTVMGLLESRGLCFDGVIIVDFNDEFIPKRSASAMFLNEAVRKKAGLISAENRENLQRFYYESLMKNAKRVSLCYVENEERLKARFLDELGLNIKEENTHSSLAFLRALQYTKTPKKLDLNPLKAPSLKYDLFKEKLSFTRLDLFLKHKRSFFYKYILGIKEARALNLSFEPKNIGIFLHKLLELYYQGSKNDFDFKRFMSLLKEQAKKTELSRLDLKRLELRFKDFERLEKEHFSKGFKILHTEYKLERKLDEKITLQGIIDRIDEGLNFKLIIDYKSGKIPEKSFQPAFYQLLFDEKAEFCFYDLQNMKKDKGKDTKTLDELKETLKRLKSELEEELCFENEQKNEYCPYKLIYEKDLK
ncbi:hypothetical protein DMB92_05105 [Campylobacter sp. MIT 99-7217]|uniref:PD-(D/E)XK nuclease family protein n=1 Tax=Campylobacter sp. MIT 99-7217 TaxID=535091 RepID=UPI00115828A9|nr:PD-(D/E)XK nuclease family protein [Campylobacter sp. MIT 99-7217]TQR32476.1 hypothetical protein DMB92_05105 [Campylobacter sp. MIT 99-7217]